MLREMGARVRVGLRGLLVGASVFTSWGCGGPDVFIMSQMHQVTESDEAPAGFSCGPLDSGSMASGTDDPSADFWMSEETNRRSMRVQIGSEEELLAERYYDREFVESREVDRFVVTTHGGAQYSFMYWGGDGCETCPPIEFEALPGDPWGCGTTPEDGN